EEGILRVWDTKLYFNAVEHYMDDTKRPENLVHMDMPGWSTTFGLVSRANLKRGNYSSEIQLNVYDNLSIAEMTMYPQDRSKKTMFAYKIGRASCRERVKGTRAAVAVETQGRWRHSGAIQTE